MKRRAAIALRVNPNVDAKTHPYMSTGLKKNKFGVAIADRPRGLYRDAARMPGIQVSGVASHIGSQLLEVSPYSTPSTACWRWWMNSPPPASTLQHLDVGGGLGARYKDESRSRPPTGRRRSCRGWPAAGSSSGASPAARLPAMPASWSRAWSC